MVSTPRWQRRVAPLFNISNRSSSPRALIAVTSFRSTVTLAPPSTRCASAQLRSSSSSHGSTSLPSSTNVRRRWFSTAEIFSMILLMTMQSTDVANQKSAGVSRKPAQTQLVMRMGNSMCRRGMSKASTLVNAARQMRRCSISDRAFAAAQPGAAVPHQSVNVDCLARAVARWRQGRHAEKSDRASNNVQKIKVGPGVLARAGKMFAISRSLDTKSRLRRKSRREQRRSIDGGCAFVCFLGNRALSTTPAAR